MTSTNRRQALMGFATLSMALPLLAQAASAQQPVDPNAQPQPNPPGSGDPAAYVQQTLTAGSFSMQTSQLAVNKAQNPRVAEFAGLEVREQQTVAQILSATGQAAPQLPQDKADMLAALQAQDGGPEFDLAYVDSQIAGHQELLAIQQQLSGMTQASVEVITAKLGEQAIASHLAMLSRLREDLTGQAG